MKTREQFEDEYAARSGVPLAEIRQWGRGAVPCDCGELECEGWAMVNLESHREDAMLRSNGNVLVAKAITGRASASLYVLTGSVPVPDGMMWSKTVRAETGDRDGLLVVTPDDWEAGVDVPLIVEAG